LAVVIISVQKVENNLCRLIKRAVAGEEIIIARGGKPVARLVRFGAAKGKRQPGSLKGKLHVGPEFFAPLPPEEITAWK
jgi:prevent-host-death family protein